jgi:hypothetical protein
MPAGATDSVQIILYAWLTTFGFILGLVVALICGHLVLDRLEAERQAAGQGYEKQETVPLEVSQQTAVDWLELPQGAWVCCGDCYARLLLSKMEQPRVSHHPSAAEWTAGEQHGLDERRHSPAQLPTYPRELTTLV